MKLTIATPDQIAERTRARWGDLQRDETLLELIRAELTARRSCPRRSLLQRLEHALGGEAEHNRSRLRKLCDALTYEGDFSASGGGMLHVSPLRAIRIHEGVQRIVSSLPSHSLSAQLPGRVEAEGVCRFHHYAPALEAEAARAVVDLQGAVLSPRTWAGLDREPIANQAWLDSLAQRLDWCSETAANLERSGALEWQGLSLTGDCPRWRQSAVQARLWRARNAFGVWFYAWTAAGQAPEASRCVLLNWDEASRTLFALARDGLCPVRATVEEDELGLWLSITHRLPRAEFRYLSISSRKWSRGDRGELSFLVGAAAADIAETLRLRLGLVVEDLPVPSDNTSADKDSEEPTLSPHDEAQTVAAGLDDDLPVLKSIGPLLLQLGVATYRDTLHLDLNKLASAPGVGRKKLSILRSFQQEARKRLPARSSAPSVATPLPSTPKSVYDDWPLEEVFGRHLPTRARELFTRLGIVTLGQMRHWYHSVASSMEIRNYGRGTHRHLGNLLKQLDSNGHETLVFGTSKPDSVESLARQYLLTLAERTRVIFTLRFENDYTLEQIGERFGCTRERVRQVIRKELELDRPTWGKRALELLDTAIQAVEERGQIALTSVFEGVLSSPPPWCLNLCCALADVSMLIDVVPGVSTSMGRDEFVALRRMLNDEITERLAIDSNANTVFDTLSLFDISGPQEEVKELATLMLGIEFEGEAAFLGRRVNNSYLRALFSAGGPVSAKEVAERVHELEPDVDASAYNAVAHFRRTKQVLHYDRGLWIHVQHLPFPLDELERVAQHCLPRIRSANGKAVSVRLLLDELREEGLAPEQLQPHTLCNALLQTGEVRGWRAGTDVAWLGAEIRRKSIEDWLRETVSELDQPFSMDELVQTVSQRSGHLPMSILVQAYELPCLIRLGGGHWILSDSVFESEEQMAQVREALYAQLPTSGAIASARLFHQHPLLARFADVYGHQLLWGLGARDERIRAKARGYLLWRSALGERLWDVIGPNLSLAFPILRPNNVGQWLAEESGMEGDASLPSFLLQEGVREKWYISVGLGWYLNARLEPELQLSAMAHEPHLLRLALGSQDFVRESPARDLLNRLRKRHGLFLIPPS